MKRTFQFFVWVTFIIFISGCGSTVEYRHTTLPALSPVEHTEGVYHKVEKGQTLWRIAQTYNVEIDEIIQVNNIPNAAVIETNQLLFIPNAKEKRPVAYIDLGKGGDDFIWPLQGEVITFYNQNKGIYRSRGIAIRGKIGSHVYASRAGKVVFSDYLNGYAQTVILDHQDGFFSVYGNNSRLTVALGDYVNKGDLIASIGSDGDKAFLHYEIRQGHRASNPLHFLP